MARSQTNTASAAPQTEESKILGVVVPTTNYPNTRFLAGVMVGTDNKEHPISVTRRGSNGSQRFEVTLGHGRNGKPIGELTRVNGHLEGQVGSREVGGVFRTGGKIMILPKSAIRNWGNGGSSTPAKSLKELIAGLDSAVPAAEEDDGVPF